MKHLDLSWNSLGRGGAGALGDALPHNSSLLWLDLRSSRLDDAALALLAPGLAANHGLRGLRVSGDPMRLHPYPRGKNPTHQGPGGGGG